MFCLIGLIFIESTKNVLAIDDITYLILVMNRIFKPFSELPLLLNETSEAMVSFRRLKEMTVYKKERVFSENIDNTSESNLAIEFENIMFSYEKQNVTTTILQDLSFEIAKGESIAIVGSSGSGKSTILKLICGFIQQDNGIYRLYGKPSNTYLEIELDSRKYKVNENHRIAKKELCTDSLIDVIDKTISKRIDISKKVGFSLSGGFDSNLLFSRAIDLVADSEINVFSYGYNNPKSE